MGDAMYINQDALQCASARLRKEKDELIEMLSMSNLVTLYASGPDEPEETMQITGTMISGCDVLSLSVIPHRKVAEFRCVIAEALGAEPCTRRFIFPSGVELLPSHDHLSVAQVFDLK